MKYISDTIVASATATVTQAIAIIRVSGSETFPLINQVFNKDITTQPANTLVHGQILDLQNKVIDEVVLSCYRAPRSFTGEDVIEINCHGGVLVTQKIIKLLLSLGIRLAEPGEFSKRAFFNNKINLTQAEAINDLIFAENNVSYETAITNLGKKGTKLINQLSDDLLAIIAEINVNIDYPEYDGVENISSKIAIEKVSLLLQKVKTIKKHSQIAQVIKTGINTAIIGKPNVGKSSLLNALLKEEKAIVSEIQGTTRDVVEGKINIGDISLNLLDTAGIRYTKDKIELIGIEKTRQAINKADLIIVVLDGSQPLTAEDNTLLEEVKNKNYIIAINKADLGLKLKISNAIKISAINEEIEQLVTVIKDKVVDNKIDFTNELILSNTRQLSCLDKVELNLEKTLIELKNFISVDLVVIFLQNAWNVLLELQGLENKVNLIDEIFKRFCLGK